MSFLVELDDCGGIEPAKKDAAQGKFSQILNRPLLITQDALSIILSHNDTSISFRALEDTRLRLIHNTAILQVHGILRPHLSFFDELFGGISTSDLQAAFGELIERSDVKKIILDIDSPGGEVAGIENFSNTIFAARGKKEIIAIANPQAASAAYWIASAADKLYLAAETAMVGSIGVLALHADRSKLNEKLGVLISEITSAPLKAITSANKPLTQAGREELQRIVDIVHAIFINAIAKNRNISEEAAQKMGNGRIYFGSEAVARGFGDGIMSLDKILGEKRQMAEEKKEMIEIKNPILSLSLENVSEKYPEIYRAIFEKGKLEGIESEKTRASGIEENTLRGFETLAQQAKRDGTSIEAFKNILFTKLKETGGLTLTALEKESKPLAFLGSGEILGNDRIVTTWMICGAKKNIKGVKEYGRRDAK